MNTIEFQQKKIKLVKSKKNKYMRLSVSTLGEIRLSVPVATNSKQISQFLDSQKTWITKTLKKLPLVTKIRYKTGEIINIYGEDYKFVVIPNFREGSKVYIDQKESKIYIFHESADLSESKEIEMIKEKLIDRLREFARKIITEQVKKICHKNNIEYNNISIREQKTRWGSCSNKGNLNFNWKIILAPKNVCHYVIAHEVAHLVEHNHSAAFWQIVYDLHPNYKIDRKWLKKNAARLEML